MELQGGGGTDMLQLSLNCISETLSSFPGPSLTVVASDRIHFLKMEIRISLLIFNCYSQLKLYCFVMSTLLIQTSKCPKMIALSFPSLLPFFSSLYFIPRHHPPLLWMQPRLSLNSRSSCWNSASMSPNLFATTSVTDSTTMWTLK